MARSRVPVVLAAVATLAMTVAPLARAASSGQPTKIGRTDWPTYGHDPQRSFAGVTKLDSTRVRTMTPRWFFQTGDAITANPIVVAGRIYVGSWDGYFYALDANTGHQVWRFRVKPQPSVSPSPDGRQLGNPDDLTSDGGIITSSAWFEPASAATRHRDLVIFGGGYTLYALDAATGGVVWQRDYTGRPELSPNPASDPTRIFSSPLVVGRKVLFGVTADGKNGYRGYIAAANLSDGKPAWRFETDVDTAGKVLNDGCGGVWSSGTYDAADGFVIFDVADCDFLATGPYSERVLALRVNTGRLAWVYTPTRLQRGDARCDYDFGATANLGTLPNGTPFLGVGGKDGTYYALEPRTGKERWETNVVFGGLAGGFIGSTAFDGKRVYGATALGDFGRFEGFGEPSSCFGDARDLPVQEPSMHSFDARRGAVRWQGVLSQSFGPTSVAGGMTFVGTGITRQIQIRDAATGTLLHVLPLPAASDSGVVVSGDNLYFGTGSSEQGSPVGVYRYSPAA